MKDIAVLFEAVELYMKAGYSITKLLCYLGPCPE